MKITVGIVTRNRPELLSKALASVFMQNVRPLEVLVLDDASDPPLEPVAAPREVHLRWWRYENNQGLIVGRNDMMRQAQGEYFVSLDDDAYFTDPRDLARAAAFLDTHPQVGVISFRVVSPGEPPFANSPPAAPHPTFTFMGGGHMLRRDILNVTGDYREFFFHQGEEIDLSYRVWDAGYQIFSFPEVTVVHAITLLARNWDRVNYYGMRNGLLTIWLNFPLPLLPFATVNLLAKKIFHHARVHTLNDIFWPSVRGLIQAFKDLPYVYKNRRSLSYQTILTNYRLTFHST